MNDGVDVAAEAVVVVLWLLMLLTVCCHNDSGALVVGQLLNIIIDIKTYR